MVIRNASTACGRGWPIGLLQALAPLSLEPVPLGVSAAEFFEPIDVHPRVPLLVGHDQVAQREQVPGSARGGAAAGAGRALAARGARRGILLGVGERFAHASTASKAATTQSASLALSRADVAVTTPPATVSVTSSSVTRSGSRGFPAGLPERAL